MTTAAPSGTDPRNVAHARNRATARGASLVYPAGSAVPRSPKVSERFTTPDSFTATSRARMCVSFSLDDACCVSRLKRCLGCGVSGPQSLRHLVHAVCSVHGVCVHCALGQFMTSDAPPNSASNVLAICLQVLFDKTGHPKVADLGVSSEIPTGIKARQYSSVGTPFWMAPEMCACEVDPDGCKGSPHPFSPNHSLLARVGVERGGSLKALVRSAAAVANKPAATAGSPPTHRLLSLAHRHLRRPNRRLVTWHRGHRASRGPAAAVRQDLVSRHHGHPGQSAAQAHTNRSLEQRISRLYRQVPHQGL